MIAPSLPLTAVQRAQLADALMLARQREAAEVRLKRRRATNIRLTLLSILILASAMSLGYHYELPRVLYSAATPAAPVEEPVDPFAATRIGQIRTPYKRDICRQVNFDNNTGAVSNETYVLCDGVVPGPGGASSAEARSRLRSLRDAFKR